MILVVGAMVLEVGVTQQSSQQESTPNAALCLGLGLMTGYYPGELNRTLDELEDSDYFSRTRACGNIELGLGIADGWYLVGGARSYYDQTKGEGLLSTERVVIRFTGFAIGLRIYPSGVFVAELRAVRWWPELELGSCLLFQELRIQGDPTWGAGGTVGFDFGRNQTGLAPMVGLAVDCVGLGGGATVLASAFLNFVWKVG